MDQSTFIQYHNSVLQKLGNNFNVLYSSYDSRLRTFEDWCITSPTHHSLAIAGFYADPRRQIYHASSSEEFLMDDVVRCFHCGVAVHGWNFWDIPLLDHYYYSRSSTPCKYVDSMVRGYFENKWTQSEEKIEVLDTAEDNQCIVCKTNPRQLLFVPCLHIAVCTECGEKIDECCVCRRKLFKSIRVYLP